MKIYLASPFFNKEQITLRDEVLSFLKKLNFEVFSPEHEAINEVVKKEKISKYFASLTIQEQVREIDLKHLNKSDIVLALVNYPDDGTAYERGYASARGIPSIDFFRDKKDTDFYNLMYSDAVASVINYDDLASCLFTFNELLLKYKENNENYISFCDYLKDNIGNKFRKAITTSPKQEKVIY